MDKILMKNMSFYGYHGVLPEENRLGQKFNVSVELHADLKKAGMTDNVEDTINYAEVYEAIRKNIEKKTFKLLEALAESIAQDILESFAGVREVTITIEKPEAPVRGIFDYFGVEIRRRRDA